MSQILRELYQDLPRPSPGSEASTRAALSLVQLPSDASILDAGCRKGHQTVTLAEATPGHIFAVDQDEEALSELNRRARDAGHSKRIRTFKAPLLEMPFAPESFDLIWSEAAVFSVGFAEAITAWRPLLKSSGYLVISELCWRTLTPAANVHAYWSAAYPKMRSTAGNAAIAERCGMRIAGLFMMPDQDWWTDYYTPLEQRVRQFRTRFRSDPEALAQLDLQQSEIELFRGHSAEYGYAFYILHI